MYKNTSEYKHSAIGLIPYHWDVQLGEEIATKITKGSSPRWQGFEYQSSGVLFVTSENVRDGFLDLTEKKYLPAQFGIKAKGSMLKDGDILINIVGASIGRSCIYKSVDGLSEANINQAVCLFRVKNSYNVKFLSYYLQSPVALKMLFGIQTDSARPNISLTDIREFPFPIPPQEEQIAIKRILESWDDTIKLTENLLSAKQEYRKWLMQQLLTGKRRLSKFKKSKELRKTPFGSLPADWEYPRIGDVAREVSERNGDQSERPVLSCTKHHGLVDSLTYFGKRIFSEDLSNYKIVRRSQFAYATNHIDEGSIGYQDTYDEALISPIYTVFQTNETMDDRFLFLILKTETYRHIFSSNTSASVDRRGSLRWSDFAKIHVPLPSMEEQKAIVKVIHTADREIDLLRKQLDALREQKKGLMQQLLTGKVRVKV